MREPRFWRDLEPLIDAQIEKLRDTLEQPGLHPEKTENLRGQIAAFRTVKELAFIDEIPFEDRLAADDFEPSRYEC